MKYTVILQLVTLVSFVAKSSVHGFITHPIVTLTSTSTLTSSANPGSGLLDGFLGRSCGILLLSSARGVGVSDEDVPESEGRSVERSRQDRVEQFLGPTIQNLNEPVKSSKDFDAVTKESFLREYYADGEMDEILNETLDENDEAFVMRKKRGGKYSVRDNGDMMPFVVKLRNPIESNSSDKKVVVGNAPVLKKKLGEFHLDRYTNCGDILIIGSQNFEVRSASCDYKYVGGGKFVVIRKTLEVTEVTRLATEKMLERQFK